ncbi:hypothetical protein BDR06DRAFT_969453 [Suillus hirtellus]|nr:hypothetical protein BDR06DRAFT_969453 [Suillus hirtellus]
MESDIIVGLELELKGSSDLGKEKAEDPPTPIDTPAPPWTNYNLFMANTKKKKAAEEDRDAKRKIASETFSKTELGSDEDIAMPWKHSIRYHPQQCDKCVKLDIACLVLPNKKFGNMRLTCAIDGVGVWQSLQSIIQHKASLEEEIKLVPTNLLEPEPTAREILQDIQDLSRRLDLFAATEQVDALEPGATCISVFNALSPCIVLHVDPMFCNICFEYHLFGECASNDGSALV